MTHLQILLLRLEASAVFRSQFHLSIRYAPAPRLTPLDYLGL